MTVEASRLKNGINIVFDTNVGYISLLGSNVLIEEVSDKAALQIILALSKLVKLDEESLKLADFAQAFLAHEIEDFMRRSGK